MSQSNAIAQAPAISAELAQLIAAQVAQAIAATQVAPIAPQAPQVKRGRGRPPGAKNKPKTEGVVVQAFPGAPVVMGSAGQFTQVAPVIPQAVSIPSPLAVELTNTKTGEKYSATFGLHCGKDSGRYCTVFKTGGSVFMQDWQAEAFLKLIEAHGIAAVRAMVQAASSANAALKR